MALTMDGMDKAEVFYCYEISQQRLVDGRFVQVENILPWAFVKFTDPGEDSVRWVSSRNGDSVGLTVPGAVTYRQRREIMRNSPFPHEADRPGLTSTDGDLLKPGPIAIHFFGPI